MNLSLKAIAISLVISGGCKTSNVIFSDDFDTQESYYNELTRNATQKEYGENALYEGHLLKNWIYSWDYSFDGDWTQAFYVVPKGKDYMEQAGRSAAPGNYRLITKTKIPENVHHYEITFRQFKNDNDPIFYHLGTNEKGDGGVKFGYMNQVPETDSTVNRVYMLGDLGEQIIEDKSYFRKWANHKLSVNSESKEIKWFVNGELIFSGQSDKLPHGGHFTLSQKYERGTRYDDIEITALK